MSRVHFAPPTTLHVTVEESRGRRKPRKESSKGKSRLKSDVTTEDLIESLETSRSREASDRSSRRKHKSRERKTSPERSRSPLRLLRNRARLGLVPSLEKERTTSNHASRKSLRGGNDVEVWRERWRRTEAAVKLQAVFRGIVVRRILNVRARRRRRFRALIVAATGAKMLLARVRRRIRAAKLIQAVHRGGQVRSRISQMLAKRLEWALTFIQRLWRIRRAAIRIQSYFRGWRQWIKFREILAGDGMKQFVVRRHENLVLKATLEGGEMRVRFPVGTCCLVSINSGLWRLHTDGNANPAGELRLRGRGRVYCSTPSVISVLPPIGKRSKLGPISRGKFFSLLWMLSGDASHALLLGNRTFTINTRDTKLVVSDTAGLDVRRYSLASARGSLGIFLEVVGRSTLRLSLRMSEGKWLTVRERVRGWEEFRKFKLSGGAKLGDACPVIPEEVLGGENSLSTLSVEPGVGRGVGEHGVYTLSNTTYSRDSVISGENPGPRHSLLMTRSATTHLRAPDAPISAAKVFQKSMDFLQESSYSSSSVSSVTSFSSEPRGDRKMMRGASSAIRCQGLRVFLRTPAPRLPCDDPCGVSWAVTHAPLAELIGGRNGQDVYRSFKVSVRGVQSFPTDDGHHGMFGIGFSTRDDFHEIPGKKNICLFGYNFSSSSRNTVNTSQRRTLYTTFYDGRQWRKLEESLLPEVGDEVELILIGGRICVLVNHWAVFVSDEMDASLLRRMRSQRVYGIVDLCGGPVYDLTCQPNSEIDPSVLAALKAKKPTPLMPIHA